MVSSRKHSFIILTMIYLAAAGVGLLTFWWGLSHKMGDCLAILVADIVATVFVWAFGLVFENVSVYDPYWSVAPPIILTLSAVRYGNVGTDGLLLLTAVWYWGIRLTGNWAYTFRNLNTEDWRYTKYRTEQKPFVFHIINFFGLNLMPTLVVFLAMLPALDVLSVCFTGSACGEEMRQCGWCTCAGFLMSIAAVTIQLVADAQRHRFAKGHRGEVCNVGLWKHGRHPNYFGEILMWWGVWVMCPRLEYLVGPVAMTSLFLFISIPLMEGRQLKNKPGYAEYKKRTRRLI